MVIDSRNGKEWKEKMVKNGIFSSVMRRLLKKAIIGIFSSRVYTLLNGKVWYFSSLYDRLLKMEENGIFSSLRH